MKLCKIKCLFKKHNYPKGQYVLLGNKVKIKGSGWVHRAYLQCSCCDTYTFVGYTNKVIKS